MTPNVLRHSVALQLLDHKVDTRVIQVPRGHKTPETTALRAAVATDLLRSVISPPDQTSDKPQPEQAGESAVRGRPALGVADVFRAHERAWRDAQRGHLSLAQLKVMSARRARTWDLICSKWTRSMPASSTRSHHPCLPDDETRERLLTLAASPWSRPKPEVRLPGRAAAKPSSADAAGTLETTPPAAA